MKVWFQHADFSDQVYELDLASTMGKYEDVDWSAELALEQDLARKGEENCPPGLGIVYADDTILHICPNPSGALVHLHFPDKAMGLFRRQRSMTLENVPAEQVRRCIRAFFEQRWDVIKGIA